MTCVDSIYSDLRDITKAVDSIESSIEELRRPGDEYLDNQIGRLIDTLGYVPDHDEFTDDIIDGIRYFLSELLIGSSREIVDQLVLEDSLNATLVRIELDSMRMGKVMND